MGLFDSLEFNIRHEIPIGYENGEVIYRTVDALKIDINEEDFGLDFLNGLPEYYRVQIGNTFYQKRPQEFINDYLNQSFDFKNNLDEILYQEIWIYKKF